MYLCVRLCNDDQEKCAWGSEIELGHVKSLTNEVESVREWNRCTLNSAFFLFMFDQCVVSM